MWFAINATGDPMCKLDRALQTGHSPVCPGMPNLECGPAEKRELDDVACAKAANVTAELDIIDAGSAAHFFNVFNLDGILHICRAHVGLACTLILGVDSMMLPSRSVSTKKLWAILAETASAPTRTFTR